MKKLYEYQLANGNHIEAIRIDEIGESTQVTVSNIINSGSEDEDEQATSIILNPSRVKLLVEVLLHSLSKEDHIVLNLTGNELKTIIESMRLAVDVLKCEVNQADMPYDLIEMLQEKFETLFPFSSLNKDA